MSYRKWSVRSADKEYAKQLSDECGIDQLSALLLVGRGLEDPEEIEDFVFGYSQLSDPFELADMDRAVERLTVAINSRERIAVYGDYDADGITATALMFRYLQKRTDNIVTYIPDRCDEGYGMNVESIDRLASDGVTLIITVDNGISCIDETAYAAQKGIDVIITDHHLPGDELPDAYAVIDPHRSDCPSEFKDFAGVGVAFKVICALEGGACEDLLPEFGPLVALGTIADIVPLISENRIIVRAGLSVMNNSAVVGIGALSVAGGLEDKYIGAQQVAFVLAPRINAAGRMGNADPALELLLTDDPDRAAELAEIVCERNALRQKTERDVFEEAKKKISEEEKYKSRVIVVWGNKWHQGVLGIVASRIVEKYGKPAIVISCDGEGCKGSARSFGEFSIYDALNRCSELLIKYGGHKQAAGLALDMDKLADFDECINRYASESYFGLMQTLDVDCRLNPIAVSPNTAKAIKLLEPFGASNPVPVFGLFGMTVESVVGVGSNSGHTKLGLSRGGCCANVMKFGTSPMNFAFRQGDLVDVAVTLEVGEYMGRETVTASVKDIRPCGISDEFYDGYLRYEEFVFSSVLSDDSEIPNRGDIACVYRQLKSDGISGNGGIDRLFVLLNEQLSYMKIRFSLEIMHELGIIDLELLGSNNFRYQIQNISQKRDIESSRFLAVLKEKAGVSI